MNARRRTALLLAFAICPIGARIPASATQAPRPVVVELFTSEGCSDCPPADHLLTEFDSENVIVLGFHVDYWDRTGWRDRFSSHDFTTRQQTYADRFRLDSIYTPQAVVDGEREMVGSDRERLLQALREAPPLGPALRLASAPHGASVNIDAPPLECPRCDVWLAITESALATDVNGGENSGRRLLHAPVVRSFTRIATFDSSKAFHASVPLSLDSGWRRDHL